MLISFLKGYKANVESKGYIATVELLIEDLEKSNEEHS